MARPLPATCPICRKPAPPGSRDYPFCGERCRTIDLAAWATEEYNVPAPLTEAEEELQPRAPESRADDE